MPKSRSDAQRIRILVTLLGIEKFLQVYRVVIAKCGRCDLGIKSMECICDLKGKSCPRGGNQIIWQETPHRRGGPLINKGFLPEELEIMLTC